MVLENNFIFIISFLKNIIDYPFFISILPVLIGGLIYLFGKIRLSNYWQYSLDNKYIPFLQGLVFINNYIFVPFLIIFFIHSLFFNSNISFTYNSLLILLLFILQYLIDRLTKKLIFWKSNYYRKEIKTKENYQDILKNIENYFKDFKENFFYFLIRKILPYILYILSYLILTNTINRLIILIVIFVLFYCLILFANIDSLPEGLKTTKILIKGKKQTINVRIVEFLNNGNLMKYEEIKTGKVKVIRVEELEIIELV